jgi:hypothetical protein
MLENEYRKPAMGCFMVLWGYSSKSAVLYALDLPAKTLRERACTPRRFRIADWLVSHV